MCPLQENYCIYVEVCYNVKKFYKRAGVHSPLKGERSADWIGDPKKYGTEEKEK